MRRVIALYVHEQTLDFRAAGFGVFRDLLGRIPWDKALEGRRAEKTG